MDRNNYKLVLNFLKNKPWILADMPMIFALQEPNGQIYYGVFTLNLNNNLLSIYKGKKGLEGFKFMCEVNDEDDVYKLRERYFSQDAITMIIDENLDNSTNDITDYLLQSEEKVLEPNEKLEFFRLTPNHSPEILRESKTAEQDFKILRDILIASNIIYDSVSSGSIDNYTFTPIRNYRGVIPKVIKRSDRIFYLSKHVLPKLEEENMKEAKFDNQMMTARLNKLPRGESWVVDVCFGSDPIWINEELDERIFPTVLFGLSIASEDMLVHMIPANFKEEPEEVLLEICKFFIEEEKVPGEILVESENAMALLKDFARKLDIPINMSEENYLGSVKEDSYNFMQNQGELDDMIAQDYQNRLNEIIGDISKLDREEIKNVIRNNQEEFGILNETDMNILLDILEEKGMIFDSGKPITFFYLIEFDQGMSMVRTESKTLAIDFLRDIIDHFNISEEVLIFHDESGLLPIESVDDRNVRDLSLMLGPEIVLKIGSKIMTLKFKDRIDTPTEKTVFTDEIKNGEN